jgi:transcriptional regulator with XRE-family HTH domain
MNIIKETFMARLKKAVDDGGFKQIELAKYANITESMVSDYLKGRFAPRPATVTKIAKALGVDPHWLAGDTIADLEPLGYAPKNPFHSDLQIFQEITCDLSHTNFTSQRYFRLYKKIICVVSKLNPSGLERLLSSASDLLEIKKYRLEHGEVDVVSSSDN